MSRARFKLGQLLTTPGAAEALGEVGINPFDLLTRHASGDWGEMCDEDKAANDAAIACEGDPDRMTRVFSSYPLSDSQKVWIITEADRSATTILLPDEY